MIGMIWIEHTILILTDTQDTFCCILARCGFTGVSVLNNSERILREFDVWYCPILAAEDSALGGLDLIMLYSICIPMVDLCWEADDGAVTHILTFSKSLMRLQNYQLSLSLFRTQLDDCFI